MRVSRRSFCLATASVFATRHLPVRAGNDFPAETPILLDLLLRYLRYFEENQYGPNEPVKNLRGLFRDRQSNFGLPFPEGQVSTSATGMGCIALALASDPKYHLISYEQAVRRIKLTLESALQLPHEAGIGPHFLCPAGTIIGSDKFAPLDWSWLLAGAGWAARFLKSSELEELFMALYRRVDWQYWTQGTGLLCHGRHQNGSLLKYYWDRYNAETLVMYVLATGAERNALPATVWKSLKPFRVGGIVSGDLGLFAHQLGLELFGAEKHLTALTGVDLLQEQKNAVQEHLRASERQGLVFWGQSNGDSPCGPRESDFYYKENSLVDDDYTINLTVSLASLRANPKAVFGNLRIATEHTWLPKLMGRYGLSNVNLKSDGSYWAAPHAVGFDVGSAVMALVNFRENDVVRRIFEEIPFAQRAVNLIYKGV